ncbi:MAG TPA: TonB-dependent receptor, partial [Chitinophagaceae bacterium]|nr:TonB-dependent receptor [Chitinophagaceae bacterium]
MVNHLKTISITSILLCSTFISSAQNINNTVTLQGKVLTSKDKPIANISSILYTAKDSVFAKVSVTDSNGFYIFERIKPGAYYIAFSGIGFKSLRSAVFNLDTQSVELPNTILQLEAQQLKDVIVTANKPMFENKRGMMIMNVDALITNAGTTTLDLLETAPAVSVNKMNDKTTISLKGREGVLILVDGKSINLSGNDLTTWLNSMPSSTIDQIEIMTNPPAKYDATGTAGAINIKTKKGRQYGMNGNVSTSYVQGIYPSANATLNLNYRNNKINVFGNYSYLYTQSFLEFIYAITNFLDDNRQRVGVSNLITTFNTLQKAHTSKLGLDYNINTKH